MRVIESGEAMGQSVEKRRAASLEVPVLGGDWRWRSRSEISLIRIGPWFGRAKSLTWRNDNE